MKRRLTTALAAVGTIAAGVTLTRLAIDALLHALLLILTI